MFTIKEKTCQLPVVENLYNRAQSQKMQEKSIERKRVCKKCSRSQESMLLVKMSKYTETAAMELNRDTQKAITNLDNEEEEIELQNVSSSIDRLLLRVAEEEGGATSFDKDARVSPEAETSFSQPEPQTTSEATEIEHQINHETSFTPRTARNLQRAHKFMDTLGRQIQITTAKITANNELIEERKRRPRNRAGKKREVRK